MCVSQYRSGLVLRLDARKTLKSVKQSVKDGLRALGQPVVFSHDICADAATFVTGSRTVGVLVCGHDKDGLACPDCSAHATSGANGSRTLWLSLSPLADNKATDTEEELRDLIGVLAKPLDAETVIWPDPENRLDDDAFVARIVEAKRSTQVEFPADNQIQVRRPTRGDTQRRSRPKKREAPVANLPVVYNPGNPIVPRRPTVTNPKRRAQDGKRLRQAMEPRRKSRKAIRPSRRAATRVRYSKALIIFFTGLAIGAATPAGPVSDRAGVTGIIANLLPTN